MENQTTTPTYATTIRKSKHTGWYAETNIPLNTAPWFLQVSTSKSYAGHLATTCLAVKIVKENGFTSTSFGLYQTYHGDVKRFADITRVTEKNIAQAHSVSLSEIQAHVDAANAKHCTPAAEEVSEA